MTGRVAYAYQTPVLAIALVIACAMPSFAAKKDLNRDAQAFETCISNITANRMPERERGEDGYRLARYSSSGGTLVDAAKKSLANDDYESATLFATLISN